MKEWFSVISSMFYRKILQQLEEWKDKSHRKPLIVRGARQVGKTTAVTLFSRQFSTYIYLNLEQPDERYLFEQNLNIYQLVDAIFLFANKKKDVGSTLIFIDEIQNSRAALAMLRYFYEKTPHIHVIAAGSLLETILGSHRSFPVGRVEYASMHPLSFSEFLTATNHQLLAEELEKIPLPPQSASLLYDQFHTYALVGGMPEIVQQYAEHRDIVALSPVYDSLLTSYMNDVEKYAQTETSRRVIRHVIETAPFHSGKKIKFEQFGNSAYSGREVSEAMRILEKSMLVKLTYPTTSTHNPISLNYKKSPKLHMLDIGLINYRLGLQQDYVGINDLSSVHQGLVMEEISWQQCSTIQSDQQNHFSFWVREKKQSSAEVDLVMQYRGDIIPIEVKAGKTGTLRSLHQFVDQSPHPYAVRVYGGMLSIEEHVTPAGTPYKLLNLPYTLMEKLYAYLDWFVGRG